MAQYVKILDTASPLIRATADGMPDYIRKALKSAAWMAQKEIKTGIKSGAPGGQPYAPTMPADLRKRIEHRKGRVRYPVLGKLVRAVGYQYSKADQAVQVGWLSKSAVSIGTKQEKGFERPVTAAMRRLYAAVGVPLSESKTVLNVPARPTFAPSFKVLEPKFVPYIEGKIAEYMSGKVPVSKSGGRKYRVFG